ncbi:TonB family protein [Cognatiyoonia sp. IB215182]|uniref:energy transducer TonB family protein n=1 Tax=Cognatiyoonia sp. IB215182 TaxID=3097353 RepID=UPI002A15EBDA|nr:TonB family protein [Cognatiyoonia sp. IB215182]MDX8355247.1 TonB family protein [Cognatiyoonia sp. IB215182]
MKRVVVILALLLSCGVHLVIVGVWPQRDTAPAGGQMAGVVALGSSFADFVEGTLESASADGEMSPTSVETKTAAEPPPDVVMTTPASANQNEVKLDKSAAASASLGSVNETHRLMATSSGHVAAIAPSLSTDVIAPTEDRNALAITASVRPVARPLQSVAAQPTDQGADVRRGNADVNATTGQQAGEETGTVSQSSAARQSTARQVGQAEINDYKSHVAARVIRVASRMRSRGTVGTVVVGMQISANGSLAAATISQSSGNQSADTIAMDAIRRAAPFDPTPNGQRISVAFRVQLVAQ